MIVVSDDFKLAMKQPVKELQTYIDYSDGSIRDNGSTMNDGTTRDDGLISVKVGGEGGLCKTVMRKIEATYLGDHNLLDNEVSVGFGVKLPTGALEYLNFGSFKVTELSVSKDTDTTSITGYDKMIYSMQAYTLLDSFKGTFNHNITDTLPEYVDEASIESGRYTIISTDATVDESYLLVSTISSSNTTCDFIFRYANYSEELINSLVVGAYIDIKRSLDTKTNTTKIEQFIITDRPKPEDESLYPITLYDYANLLCVMCGLELGNTDFTVNDNLIVDRELFANVENITYRDIFQQIAQATASTCIIGNDDKVYFKPIYETGEQLTYDNLFKLKLEGKYGVINSIVLARTPQEDNVYLKDEASIELNGLTELKIENNQFLDTDRETYIQPIFNALNGVFYYPFEATTEGLGWYEIGDNFTIVTDTDEEFSTTLFNYNITLDGSLKETLKTVAESKTQTQYQYATSITKRVKNAELMVNKQDLLIQGLITDVREEDGIVNKNYTEIKQSIENINFAVQNSGGNNLLLNSVMFAHDGEKVTNWVIEGDGAIEIGSNVEALHRGGLSGNSFALTNKIAKQTIQVMSNSDDNEEKVYYSFSCKVDKKNISGTWYVKIYNTNDTNEVYGELIETDTTPNYQDYEIVGMLPKSNIITIEFGTDGGSATFTDNMLSKGENKSQWTQANGEIMNANVNINTDGVKVYRVNEKGELTGDYTVMSPYEFAGYSKESSNADERVFSLNGAYTEVEKLRSRTEITQAPIKVVPVTEGDLQGWAFVSITEGE